MPGNKAVAYIEPGKVETQTIDYPELVLKDGPGVNPANVGRQCPHGVILKVVSTNICGVRPAHGPRPDDGAVGTDPRP
jgi:glutathione-independent formaldehyde dehydrogenase